MDDGNVWEVVVRWKEEVGDPRAKDVAHHLALLLGPGRDDAEGGTERLRAFSVTIADRYFFQGDGLTVADLERVARTVLADSVTQEFEIHRPVDPAAGPPAPGAAASEEGEGSRTATSGSPGGRSARRPPAHHATVLKKPGVMDPVEGSLLNALEDLGIGGVRVRTAIQYFFGPSPGGEPGQASQGQGMLSSEEKRLVGQEVLSNSAIESVHWEDEPPPLPFRKGHAYVFEYREVPLEGLGDEELLEVSRKGQLSLNLDEMRAIRDYFRGLRRAPSDVEMETLAQTWSEHCCHKTLTGVVEHEVEGSWPQVGEGREREAGEGRGAEGRRCERIDNLFRSTIRKATEEINAPWCLSVFVDNAGVIAFDEDYGVTFKVETHNHPSAIEPYGGAGTGIGGVLRDTVGTGLGAKPIANTDVFCFGPPDMPQGEVPAGALHPLRVLRGVVSGVRDYGNRMGIPTASGAVYFDARYTGNPLVYCGSIGIIPRDMVSKSVRPGDRIYVLGGRTGRDGIHGATFSSAELTEESETVSSGAVQIGNAITEKKLFDVILQARDRRLYRAITDCGAGGLSSAVGEMGAAAGAQVHLERVPLKYEGLSYWEIWISEAQERMVVAVPPECGPALEALASSEDVECTEIGEFTDTGRLVLFYEGHQVCDLEMTFLHDGRPRWVRRSVCRPPQESTGATGGPGWSLRATPGKTLHALLESPNIASKEWIIRQYDHEVQGRSVLKPLVGVEEDGPGDAAAFAPRFGSKRGIVIGCGMNPLYGDLDPYRMALSAVDEAVRNVVCVGGDPEKTALLDNFCWGNTDRPEVLGSLVEAARGCYVAAVALGTPFISGKDSLRNEFRVGGKPISIPPSLLISSISVIEDVHRLVSMDLKRVGSRLVLVGETREELGGSHLFRLLGVQGGRVPDFQRDMAPRIHRAVSRVLGMGLALSCHDLSEGGLAVAAAEMAFAGGIGAEIHLDRVRRSGCERDEAILFSETNTRYLLEVRLDLLPAVLSLLEGVPAAVVGETVKYRILRVMGRDTTPVIAEALGDLKASWKRTLHFG